ncbi:uncharacterized protein LOC114281895 [Camellia sinensis]|uniref:uncharacterized protein LOC114281895 n=1 Tax=Camellia sinensis TaxID=4442 RepID=UPI001036B5F4|nr:uncharacterized protein LOC114281895 [Camellia sinensis]
MVETQAKPLRSIEVVRSVDVEKVVLQKLEDKIIRHLRPLYVRAYLDGVLVERVLVDNGAIVNIVPSKTLKAIGKSVDDLLPTDVNISNFASGSSEERSSGFTTLGRDWIHLNGCVPFSLHQALIFLTSGGKGEIEVYWADANPFVADVNNVEAVLYDEDLGPIVIDEEEVKSQGKSLTNEEFKAFVEEGTTGTFDDLKTDVQDPLEEYNLGSKACKRPIYVNAKISNECKSKLVGLLSKYMDCFVWNYEEMPGLDRALVEHSLPIKGNFFPHKQPPRRMTNEVTLLVDEEIKSLLKAGFIRTNRYVEWLSNIIDVMKKNGKLRVCIDFRNLNLATPKDEYPISVANLLLDLAAKNKILSFMDGHAGYNQIFINLEDTHKTAFKCPGALGI